MACVVQWQLGATMHSDSAHRRSMSVISSKPLDNLAVVRDRPLLVLDLEKRYKRGGGTMVHRRMGAVCYADAVDSPPEVRNETTLVRESLEELDEAGFLTIPGPLTGHCFAKLVDAYDQE